MSLTVGDGFKFGCGLILSMVAFYFLLVIFATGVFLLAMILNIQLPSAVAQPFKFLFFG
ncbi:MAG: hypothetical protein M1343_05290 [Chloroflexi bacterium]|nr:hypothetical protein [Chloroflexota bacterium]MDA8187937.1 hypothetical protein [Dehalococcoidales bacterium]